jgi:DNA-binding transcriptional LysR family regulator
MLLSDEVMTLAYGSAMPSTERIGRRIKIHDLHVLMTVVQAGSMGKAADRLNVTQPAVSRSIAELEHLLGVRLLDRHRQGIEPTKFGRALLDCGVAVFDDLRQGVQNIEFLTDPTAGEVRIGCNSILAASFVSAVIDRLSRRYPQIAFHFVIGQISELHRELSERNVDVLVAQRLGPIADERLDFDFVFDDSFVVAAAAGNPWTKRRKIDLTELANEPWVLPPLTSVTGSILREAFRARGLDYPRTAVFVLPTEVRISLMMTGRYLTILAGFALTFPAPRPQIKVLPVELPLPRAPVGIVTVKNRTLSPVVRLFIDAAHEVAKPLVNRKR